MDSANIIVLMILATTVVLLVLDLLRIDVVAPAMPSSVVPVRIRTDRATTPG